MASQGYPTGARQFQGDDPAPDPGGDVGTSSDAVLQQWTTSTRAHGAGSGACYPDPDPDAKKPHPKADDVTRMNATPVHRIVFARNEIDIKRVLFQARSECKRVSCRGTKHSMGGQSIAEDAVIIDMTKMTDMTFNADSQTVTCETGCTWADLILYLNQFGMSPRTMQSYSTFSVGGTLAVNGHGITTDYTMSECVKTFRLIKWDGTEVVCSREAEGEGRELFGLALGGYGLFGIMWQVTMKVNRNSRMEMEAMHLTPDEFMRYHAASQETDDVVMKLARLNIIDTNSIDFFVFRRMHDSEVACVSDLGRKPREISWKSRLMYKWLMPMMKEARYAMEKKAGAALDWAEENETNFMLFESAAPLAQLYEPLFRVDDTFVLQEFFCPRSNFKAWLARTSPIYAELAGTQKVILLNTTIRFVKKDTDTCMAYSKSEEGMFAFVLYYRLPRTPAADAELHRFHTKFADVTLALDGTFYLPYRFHYTHQELETAYPRFQEFFEKKEKYDPHGFFDNLWLRQYGTKYVSEKYGQALTQPLTKYAAVGYISPAPTLANVRCVSERRSDSYNKLVSSPSLRRDFRDGFLTQIFNILDNKHLFRMVVQATRDPENKNDIEIYRAIQRELGQLGGPMHEATKTWKQLKQLSAQKKELAREVCSIVTRLGKFGQLHDLVCVGDGGKAVLPLRETLEMQGKSWVVHHDHSDDIPLVVERGSLAKVGEPVYWDLIEAGPFLGIPDESVDLLTMLQGLHHLPHDRIIPFLNEVKRVLRPGGIFIVREHNATESLIPMLDLAHSVFNVVLGVSDKEEEKEIRAFRPVLEWREIVESAGLVDSLLYEMEPFDVTWDEMMCFYKPPLFPPAGMPTVQREYSACESDEAIARRRASTLDALPPQFAAVLDQAPAMLLASILGIIDSLLANIPSATEALKEKMKILSAGQSLVAEQLVDQTVEPLMTILNRFRPFFSQVELSGNRDSALGDIVPKELFLLPQALLRKAEQGKASANELFAVAIIKDVQVALMGSSEEAEAAGETAKADEDAGPDVSAADVQRLLEDLVKAFPEMRDKEAMGKSMGLNDRAQSALRSQMSIDEDANIGDVSRQFASYLDEQSWNELRGAIFEAIQQKQPPSGDLIFGRVGENNPWCKAMMAFLGSKHVQFKPAALAACSWVGLGEVAKMWKLAQGLRQKQAKKATGGNKSLVAMPDVARTRSGAERMSRITAAMEGLAPGLKEVQMAEGKQYDIKDVAQVIEAKYGYESLTARLKDVTSEIRKKVFQGELRLRNLNLQDAFGTEDSVGSALDSLRKGVLQKTRYLTIKYRSSAEPAPEDFIPRTNVLLDRLTTLGMTDKLHPDDGEYTWYKLNEWMQVEILQIFGASLEHTPWYRFPFTEFLKIYFDCLVNEAGIVAKRMGPKKAFSTMGFVTSLVPGIIMAFMFGQIQLMAMPLLALPESSGFGEGYDQEKMIEQLVVLRPTDAEEVDWHRIDERISNVRCPVKGLFIMSVPTFKPLTEVLMKLSLRKSMRVLEVSNQRHIQVRVTVPQPEPFIQMLSMQHGCEVMFNFKYPTDGSADAPGTIVPLCVAVPYLLAVLRFCQTEGIAVDQVYDFCC